MREVVVSTTAGGEDRITTGGDVAYGNGDNDNDNRHHRGGVEGGWRGVEGLRPRTVLSVVRVPLHVEGGGIVS